MYAPYAADCGRFPRLRGIFPGAELRHSRSERARRRSQKIVGIVRSCDRRSHDGNWHELPWDDSVSFDRCRRDDPSYDLDPWAGRSLVHLDAAVSRTAVAMHHLKFIGQTEQAFCVTNE